MLSSRTRTSGSGARLRCSATIPNYPLIDCTATAPTCPLASPSDSPAAVDRVNECESPAGLRVELEAKRAAVQFEMTVNFLNGSLNVQTDRVPFGNEAMSPALSSTRSPVATRSIATEPSRT